MGSINCPGKDPLVVLEEALKAGIRMFQLREKGEGALSGQEYVEFARKCQHLCQLYQVPFIVNDDVQLAQTLDADGIHVGQDDGQAAIVRRQCPDKILGVSVHTLTQFDQAIHDGADYVGIGPIFHTKSKANAKQSSIEFLREARDRHPQFPIVAIGGITTNNSHFVREVGVNGVAVISEITESDYIDQTVNSL